MKEGIMEVWLISLIPPAFGLVVLIALYLTI